MYFPQAVAAALLLADIALAGPLATIVPCSEAPRNVTATSQHQAIPTCTKSNGKLLWSSYDYVSTVISCWGESSISSCTVTDTAQLVPISRAVTTATSVVPITTKHFRRHYPSPSYSTVYETVSKEWVAPYKKLGGFAIPGYGGCELCEECGTQEDETRTQALSVTECTSVAGEVAVVCSKYTDT